MSKKNLDCLKLIDKNCISKLENLFASRSNEPPKNNTIGSKNIIKNENKVESNSNSKPPPPPLPPPLPIKSLEKIVSPPSLEENISEPINNEAKINVKPVINKNNSTFNNLNCVDNENLSNKSNFNNDLNILRYRLPLQRKLEELGEVILDNQIKEFKLKEIPIQIPEWFIGLIAGTITTTFLNIVYFKLFG